MVPKCPCAWTPPGHGVERWGGDCIGCSPLAPQGIDEQWRVVPIPSCVTLTNKALQKHHSKPCHSPVTMETAYDLSSGRCPHLVLCPLLTALVLLLHGDSLIPAVCSSTCGFWRLWKSELVPVCAVRAEVMKLLISQQLMPA